jgi:hypothetical protein
MYSHLQKDLHNVIARLAKSAEAISQMSMRLPRFARNDGQNSILVYVVNYSCPIYFTLQNLWILRGPVSQPNLRFGWVRIYWAIRA